LASGGGDCLCCGDAVACVVGVNFVEMYEGVKTSPHKSSEPPTPTLLQNRPCPKYPASPNILSRPKDRRSPVVSTSTCYVGGTNPGQWWNFPVAACRAVKHAFPPQAGEARGYLAYHSTRPGIKTLALQIVKSRLVSIRNCGRTTNNVLKMRSGGSSTQDFINQLASPIFVNVEGGCCIL